MFKFLSSNTAVDDLRDAVEKNKARQAELTAIGQRTQALENEIAQSYAAMLEKRDVTSVQAWVNASIAATQQRGLWEKASIAVREAESAHTSKLLAPKVIAALESMIDRLTMERRDVIAKEREIADGIGVPYAESTSVIVRQLGDTIARAERLLAAVRAGDAGAVQSAVRFCLS